MELNHDGCMFFFFFFFFFFFLGGGGKGGGGYLAIGDIWPENHHMFDMQFYLVNY